MSGTGYTCRALGSCHQLSDTEISVEVELASVVLRVLHWDAYQLPTL